MTAGDLVSRLPPESEGHVTLGLNRARHPRILGGRTDHHMTLSRGSPGETDPSSRGECERLSRGQA